MKIDPKWLTFGLTDDQVKGAVIIGWRGVLIVHIAWACGWLGYAGLGSGFAYAGDVTHVRDELTSLKVELLEQQIWDSRVRQCEAFKANQPAPAYALRLSQLLTKYQALTGRTYPLLSCSEQ